MRIVQISPFPAAPVATGAMARIAALATRLARHHEVDLVTTGWPPRRPRERGVRTRRLAAGLRQHEVLSMAAWAVLQAARRSWPVAPLTSGLALRLARPPVLRDLLARADLAIVEFPWQVGYVRRLRPEVPLVLCTHNVESLKFASWARAGGVAPESSPWLRWIRKTEAAAMLQPDLVVSVSPTDRSALISRFGLDPARVVVVPNGADVERIVPATEPERERARRELGLPDRPVALFVGAPVAPNRLGLRWVRRLAERTDRFTFVVAGDVAEPERTERVIATGWVSDLRPYLRAASVGLCPIEHGGGTKIKLLEGLAAGLPMIAFPHSVRGTDLTPGRELLVVEPREDALIAALERLATESELRADLGRAGRAAIERRYAWDDSADLLEAALADLVSERARRPAGPLRARTPG